MVGMLVCVVTFRNYSATSRLPDLLLPWQNNTKEFHVFVVNIPWQSHFKYITNSSTIPRLYIIRKDGNAKFPINGISQKFCLEKLSLSILDIYWINIFTNSLKDWLIYRTIYIKKNVKFKEISMFMTLKINFQFLRHSVRNLDVPLNITQSTLRKHYHNQC